MHSHNDSIELSLFLQMGESGGAAVRKSSR